MKSYTDIEQSKKLAEILPIESADMCHNINKMYKQMPPLMTPYSKFEEFFDMEKTPDFLIPCWSLTSLFGILPDEITDSDGCVYRNEFFHLKGKYIIQYPRLTTLWPSLLFVEADNPIDACYEMVLKLHEKGLI